MIVLPLSQYYVDVIKNFNCTATQFVMSTMRRNPRPRNPRVFEQDERAGEPTPRPGSARVTEKDDESAGSGTEVANQA